MIAKMNVPVESIVFACPICSKRYDVKTEAESCHPTLDMSKAKSVAGCVEYFAMYERIMLECAVERARLPFESVRGCLVNRNSRDIAAVEALRHLLQWFNI